MFKMRTAQPGFSLTEIIIAITIVGIMVAGTLGMVSYIGTAKRRSAESNMRLYKNMIDQYRQDVGSYPTSLNDLKDRPADETVARKWKGPYLESEIQDPWGAEYQYMVNAKGAKPPFDLYSFGSNGEGAADTEWIRA